MIKKNLEFIFLLSLSFLPLISLLHPGLPLTHDGQDHVARIANFYQNLAEGNIIPRWAGNLNWGYGHPILMFLYPLPSYFASIFHFVGFSLVDSLKIVFGLSFILSGLSMFVWLREFLDDESAVFGSILYLFAPYRFIDLYVRGAIGEHVAFLFPPLILYFLLKLSKGFNKYYFAGASISIGGLILAHNAISLMFLPFIIFYMIYLIWNSKKKKELIYHYIFVLCLGLCLSAFFVVPAYLEGKYTLRDIVTGAETLARFVTFSSLLYGPWNFGQSGQFSVQVGIFQWISVIFSPLTGFLIYKREKKLFPFFLGILLYFVFSIIIMLPISSFFWKTFTVLEKFQFPWRFLTVSVFSASVLGAIVFYGLNKKIKTAAFISVVIFLLIFNRDYWKPKDYLSKPESFYSWTYDSTTDTGESSPIWSVRFMEHRPSAHIEIIEGTGRVTEVSRTFTVHKYKVDLPYRSRIRENTLYFPGWNVYLDDKKYQGLQFQDPKNRGLITFYVLAGKHNIEVRFENTKLRTLSSYLSILSLILVTSIIFGIPAKMFKK